MGSTPIGISGSRAAAVLGLSKYQTPLMVWQNLMETLRPGFNAERGYILEPFEGNASTRFGLAFESAVIELTEQQTGEKITDQEGEYFLDGAVPITCHIDGRFSPDKIFEGKTVYIRGFDASWGEPGTDRIPQEYQVQCQHNMMLTGAKECHVSALIFPKSPTEWEEEGWETEQETDSGEYLLYNKKLKNPLTSTIDWAVALDEMGYFKTYNIKANPAIQEVLKAKYLEFWTRYVLTETPPEITDFDDLRRIFPEPKGQLIVPDKILGMIKEYSDIGKEIGASGHLKKRQNILKTLIVDYCKDKAPIEDEEAIEKLTLLDDCGNNTASWDGKTFRAKK